MEQSRIRIILLYFGCLVSMITQALIPDYDGQKKILFQEIREAFRRRNFVQYEFPNDFSYLEKALELAKVSHEPRAFVNVVIREFMRRARALSYVNAETLQRFIMRMPELLSPYFELYKTMLRNPLDVDVYTRLQFTFSKTMVRQINTSFDTFKRDPEDFLNELSKIMVETACEEISMGELRMQVLRFLDVCISKAVWSSEDPDKAWETLKDISIGLRDLFECNIVGEIEELEDLFRALIHRFSFFLEATGEQIPLEFYNRLKNEITTQQLLILELEEQNDLFESKADCLMQAVLQGERLRTAAEKQLYIEQQIQAINDKETITPEAFIVEDQDIFPERALEESEKELQ